MKGIQTSKDKKVCKYVPPKVMKQSCHGGGGATKGC